MKKLWLLAATIFLVCASGNAQTVKAKMGKGIGFVAADSSLSMQFNTRFQTQYVGVHQLDSKDYTDQFTIRRFRLKFKGFMYKPEIQYKIELALSNRDQGDFFAEHRGAASIVLDAVLKWKFAPGWQLWVGQTKLPGNRQRVISSGALQLVDRSILNSRYNIDRDKGLWLHHEHKLGSMVVREIVAMTSGEGRNISGVSNDSGYDYTFRGELLPFGKFTNKGDYFGADLARESSPKLSIGVTYDHNFGTNRERGQLGRFLFTDVVDDDGKQTAQRSDLSTVFVDAMFKYSGFSVLYEYANKKVADGRVWGYKTGATDINDILYFYTGVAHSIQTGYLFKNNMAVDFRFSDNKPAIVQINPLETTPEYDFHTDPEKRYEIGFSKFIVGHTLKFQASAIYRDRLTKEDQMIYMAQLEIGI